MTNLAGELFGNYRLERQVGHGGFADVYLGTHIYLQTQAAIKILQVQFANDALQSFLSEARTMIQLEHPHIVRILECGVEKNLSFLVMSYAPGGSLRQRYPLGTCTPLEHVMQYVGQAASALHYAHRRQLIHRDIKPENMLLSQDDALLLSDFGLALQVRSTNAKTMQEMAGTVPYMSPEQLQGKPQPASDQYALGIVAYEWLSGDRPFHGSFVEVASQHVLVMPPPLYGRVPGISREMEQVVFTALAKSPQERFPSVQAFADALAQAITSTRSQEEGAPLPTFSPPPPSSSGESLSSSALVSSSEAFAPSFTLGRKPGPNATSELLSAAQSANFSPELLSATHLLPIDKQPTTEIAVVSQSDILTSMGKGRTHLLSPGATPLPPGVTSQMTAQSNSLGSFPTGAMSTFRHEPFLLGQNTLSAPTQGQKKQRRTVIALAAALVTILLILLLVLMPVVSPKSGPLFANNAAPGSDSSSLGGNTTNQVPSSTC